MSNVLRAFQIIEQDGMKTVNSTYNVLDGNGNIITKNKKDSFYSVDPGLTNHIEAIAKYIKENRLS